MISLFPALAGTEDKIAEERWVNEISADLNIYTTTQHLAAYWMEVRLCGHQESPTLPEVVKTSGEVHVSLATKKNKIWPLKNQHAGCKRVCRKIQWQSLRIPMFIHRPKGNVCYPKHPNISAKRSLKIQPYHGFRSHKFIMDFHRAMTL